MLVNAPEKGMPNVKFISYTGRWPCLCSGVLTLEIAGERAVFNDLTAESYARFWASGGRCRNTKVYHGEWIVDYEALPDKFREYACEIDAVINAMIVHGCCGGCI